MKATVEGVSARYIRGGYVEVTFKVRGRKRPVRLRWEQEAFNLLPNDFEAMVRRIDAGTPEERKGRAFREYAEGLGRPARDRRKAAPMREILDRLEDLEADLARIDR